MSTRKWLPSFGELTDRLFICQLKELLIPEKREVYTNQINDITHDLDKLCAEHELNIDGRFILTVGNIMLMNRLIWENESNMRNGIETGNDLAFTHAINTLRTSCYSLLSQMVGERGEFKKDTLLAPDNWIPSLLKNN